MSMEIETQLSDQIARYLDLAAAEAKLTAANMANVDTPGYRTVGMDFEAEMREALDEVERGRGPRKVRVTEVDGLIARPDGNNVSIDRESLQSGRSATEVQDRRGAAAPGVSARDGRDPRRQVKRQGIGTRKSKNKSKVGSKGRSKSEIGG